ncbi:MAG: acyl-CoA mutase large subunit family protein [Planctomycetota bacterium]|jgi:methylmalonyl-CoA mutase N-terminal domain/subunit
MSAGAPPEGKPVYNESGVEIKPVYTQGDVEASGNGDGVGLPGEFPFTRGIHPFMYRKRPWTMRQYAGFGQPQETNERFRYLIDQGQTGLNVAFDLPTQVGLDSDDPAARGEVGRVGMAVDTLEDFEIAFAEIDLDKITVSLTINGAAPALIAMYFAMARRRGYDVRTLRGTAQNDILKEFVGRGTWVFPVEPSIKLVGDTILYCAEHAPLYSPVSVCGYHIRESGATPAQEMAYAFCIAKAYIDHVLARGLDIDDFASRLSFNFDIHGSLFEQVAKFRAGRRLWAKIVGQEYGATNPRSQWLRMIAGGGGRGLTIEQPENNIVRGAYYALASALAGTQTMALCSYDEAFTIPTEKAARISLRTMQILIEEMGLCDTVDPLAGSYYVETLTNQMEQRIRAVMKEVDEQGGIVGAIADGRIQDSVSRQAYEYLKKVESGEIRRVGENCFRIEEAEPDVAFHPFDQAVYARQVERLQRVRRERDHEKVAGALKKVGDDARADRNVMPGIIDAVTACATVGEITGVLVEVYGRYEEPVRF